MRIVLAVEMFTKLQDFEITHKGYGLWMWMWSVERTHDEKGHGQRLE